MSTTTLDCFSDATLLSVFDKNKHAVTSLLLRILCSAPVTLLRYGMAAPLSKRWSNFPRYMSHDMFRAKDIFVS
jgi:hypothetical protein